MRATRPSPWRARRRRFDGAKIGAISAIMKSGTPKMDQLRSLREQRAARANRRTDEALARERPKAGASRSPRAKVQAGVGSERSSPAVQARSQAVKAVGFGPAIGGSNPPAPAKRGRPRLQMKPSDGPLPWIAAGVSRRTWYRRKQEAK